MNLLSNLGYVESEAFAYLNRDLVNLPLIADLIRFNTLLSVARAGTGHLGASLSMVEILTEIYFRSFQFDPEKMKNPDRDIFILSKGHGVPSLYAVLAAKGFFPTDDLDRLRRLGGLQGHSDISVNGIEANTGSLAMGLSKAVGFALAKKRFKNKGKVIVIVGDGELQEGECWEAFLSAVSYRLDNLLVIIDDNRVQTDAYTGKIVAYGDIPGALIALGFSVLIGQADDIGEINKSFLKLNKMKLKPGLFYALTKKGQGISFMEHPNVLRSETDKYIWHNKPPDQKLLEKSFAEIFVRVQGKLTKLGFTWDLSRSLAKVPRVAKETGINGDNLVDAFSQSLLKNAAVNKKIVVFDADLEEDCGFIPFHRKYPDRYFEMGIMEQNMVSVASAFARSGYLPVISSYAAFLTSRANEQLYNLASEKGRALIVGNMSGILPATPGKSHASFRDISLMKNIPGISIYQPVCGSDVKNILAGFFRNGLGELLYLRLSTASSALPLPAPDPDSAVGKTHLLKAGKNAIFIGIGPVILGEGLKAAEILSDQGISLEVRNHPWLLNFDKTDFKNMANRQLPLLICEDHYFRGGFGESLLAFLKSEKIRFSKIRHLAMTDFPKSGFREEALEKFKLNGKAITAEIKGMLK